MSNYWLTNWIDTNGIRSTPQARLAIRTKSGRRSLTELATASEQFDQLRPTGGHQLIAGHTMDLSGQFQCSEAECLKKQVDELLGRAWHYFDEVVVTGLDPWIFLSHVREGFNESLEQSALRHVEVALHIREIGAEDSVRFIQKPHYCTAHLQVHAEECGYEGDIEEMAGNLRRQLLGNHRLLEYKPLKRGRIQYAFKSDLIDIIHTGRLKVERRLARHELAERLSEDLSLSYAGARVRDALVAQKLAAPLGDATAYGSDVKASAVVPGGVAFNLQLPMVESLPISEILKIRNDHAAEYQAFRAALRKAIEERIKALPDKDADSIADSVYEDILEPEIIRLQRKMDAAVAIAGKRSLATAFVGATVTTVGLTSFAPIAATGIAISATAGLAAYLDWLKDKKEVQMSDLHFLMKLDRAAVAHTQRT